RRKPLIFDAYELPLVQPHLTRHRAMSALLKGIVRWITPRCAGVITVSPGLVPEMRRLYGGPTAQVVRNVPVYQRVQRTDMLRQRLGVDEGRRIALYQGGLQENRSLDRLVRAARYLPPEVVVVLLGYGPQEA